MMFQLYHHFFYRIYCWNSKIIKESKELSVITALLGTTLIQVLSITVIIFALLIFFLKNVMVYPKWLQMILMLVVLVLNYFFIIHNRFYKAIILNGEKMEKKELKQKDIQIAAYIFLLVLCLIWLITLGRSLT